MSFDSIQLQQQSQFTMISNGFPGLFTYISGTDNLNTILTNGYFPSSILSGWIGTGDFVQIKGIDGSILKYFDSNFYLNDIVIFPSTAMNVNTITASSGNLLIDTCYIFNNLQTASYTLPTAVGNVGKRIVFKKISLDLLTCTINTINGETIDGSGVLIMSLLNVTSTIISDGSNWFIIG